MKDLIAYVAEGGLGAITLAIPFVYKLYKELLHLRKQNPELREKIAYLKGKYIDKHEHKSHGRKKE